MKTLRIVVAAVCLALLSCASLRVDHDYDRSADFSSFRRFTWLQREHHGSANPLVVERTRVAIEADLVREGFVYSDDAANADFIVDFTIGSQERVDLPAQPIPYLRPFPNYSDWWGYRYWGSAIDLRVYREGTLSIDVFDARTHSPVWHGWATKELTKSDVRNSERPIRAAVEAVLAKFPPRT